MLKITDNSEEAIRAHHAAVAKAWETLKAARATRDEAKDEWETLARRADSVCEAPFAKAEAGLVAAGQLVSAPQIQQDEGHDCYSRRGARSDSRSCGQSRRGGVHGQRKQPDENQEGPPRKDIIRDMRDDKQRLLEDARCHLIRMEESVDNVRDHYYHDLDRFLHDKDAGRNVGTQSDFDRNYYLARKDVNHRRTLAQQAWEFALGEADETEALTREQRVSYLDDWGESEHGEHEFERDLIWEATEQVIEVWLDDEGMRETRSVRHWRTMQEYKNQGG